MSDIFGDWVAEADAAEEAGESLRTWQRRRQNRTGPPYVKIGSRIFYRKEAIRAWLLDLEVKPVRAASRGRTAALRREAV